MDAKIELKITERGKILLLKTTDKPKTAKIKKMKVRKMKIEKKCYDENNRKTKTQYS